MAACMVEEEEEEEEEEEKCEFNRPRRLRRSSTNR